MNYIYTKKGEARAKELGLEDRKAGTEAMYGGEPLLGGLVAKAWLEKGYISEVENET